MTLVTNLCYTYKVSNKAYTQNKGKVKMNTVEQIVEVIEAMEWADENPQNITISLIDNDIITYGIGDKRGDVVVPRACDVIDDARSNGILDIDDVILEDRAKEILAELK